MISRFIFPSILLVDVERGEIQYLLGFSAVHVDIGRITKMLNITGKPILKVTIRIETRKSINVGEWQKTSNRFSKWYQNLCVP